MGTCRTKMERNSEVLILLTNNSPEIYSIGGTEKLTRVFLWWTSVGLIIFQNFQVSDTNRPI